MLMQVQFGPGAPTLFKIPWTDSTEAALGAGVSWQDTDRLRRKRGNQMCHRLFFFFFMQEQGDTTVTGR